MTIIARILLAFSLVIGIFFAQSAATVWNMDRLAKQISLEAERPIVLVDSAHSIWSSFSDASDYLGVFLSGTQFRSSAEALAEFKAKLARAEEQLERLTRYSTDQTVGDLATSAAEALGKWKNDGLVLIGEKPATQVPAPHILKAQGEKIGAILGRLTDVSLAKAGELRQQMVDSAVMARNWAVLLAGIGAAIGISLAVMSALSITRPLGRVVEAMKVLAADETEFVTPEAERRDEIGQVANMVEQFRTTAVERQKLKDEHEAMRQKEVGRQRQLEKLISEFRVAMADIAGTLEHERGGMSAAAESLSSTASLATDRAQRAARESSGAAQNTQTVAAATEQLSASIRDIADQAERAQRAGDEAARAVRTANDDVEGLTRSSRQIEQIISMITEIAEQTNLLALNSTIEAARAGEAGRGFAVVAAEVKSLAARSADAASQVGKLVESMQGSTFAAVNAMTMITEKIQTMAALNGSIAASVSEQRSATQEISASILRAAESSQHAGDSADEVKAAAADTMKQSERVGFSSQSLAKVTGDLSKRVDSFLYLVSQDLEERRKSVRHDVDAVVNVEANGKKVEARVRNASVAGLNLVPSETLREGQMLRIELPQGMVAARVRWTDGRECGIEFDRQLQRMPFEVRSTTERAA